MVNFTCGCVADKIRSGASKEQAKTIYTPLATSKFVLDASEPKL